MRVQDIDGPPNDLDVQPNESETIDSEASPPDYKISVIPADLTLESLYTRWGKKELLIPGFQRKFVWKLPQSSKLVESFLLGLPVPAVFLYKDKEEKHEVIDGQQRLKSIFYFFEGYFGDEDSSHHRTVFRLKGLNERSRFYDKSYPELEEVDQRRLKNGILRAFIIEQLNPNDNTSIYHIFERLNTGGTVLKNQEVRNCVYWGPFNDTLQELNKFQPWRNLVGGQVLDRRMKDVELILRFLTFHDLENLDDYQRPMNDFLSGYMSQHRMGTSDFLDNKGTLFKKTCNALISNLAEKPFHIHGALNVAVLDSVSVAFSKHLQEIPTDIKDRYSELIKDEEYLELVTGPTADVSNVKGRMNKANRVLFG
jgi:hypothetical protein